MGRLPIVERLLDTHTLLWCLADDPELPVWVKDEIESDSSRFGVSDVILWEIAIKRSTGKLRTPDNLPELISDLGFQSVPIAGRQIWVVRDLPFHHRDPFDRLLVAQAQDLGLPLVSADSQFEKYGIEILWNEGPIAAD